jgi:transketolase
MAGMKFFSVMDTRDLRIKAEEIRKDLLTIIYNSKAGHTGGSLSSADILTTLYFDVMKYDAANPLMDERDRFILSKGHSVEGYLCTLYHAGFFGNEILETYGKYKSMLAGHPTVNVPGIEICSGALGHGLSVGAGMALAARMDEKDWRVFVLMGDGEQAEGSVYEAALAAAHYRLDNLIAIIDRNFLQISGNTEDVMTLEPINRRWESTGWEVLETDGNDIENLQSTFRKIPVNGGKPHLIIARTVKGKGVSFMENQAGWHHKVPDEKEYQRALNEIEGRIRHLRI